MERLEFSYSMKIAFSAPVVRHCFSLRCLPFSNAYQRVCELFLEVSPHNVLTETADGFGNRILTDRITQEHTDFSVCQRCCGSGERRERKRGIKRDL